MIALGIIPIWLMTIICILLIILVIKSKKGLIRRIMIICLLFMANARIMIPSGNAKVLSSNLDILFVIDNTISMVAEDHNGGLSRIEAVKKDCEYILDYFERCKIFSNYFWK